jgi:hypothetical protein
MSSTISASALNLQFCHKTGMSFDRVKRQGHIYVTPEAKMKPSSAHTQDNTNHYSTMNSLAFNSQRLYLQYWHGHTGVVFSILL